MAVPIIAGADLVALAGVLLLIGLIAATAYTFERLADVLDVRILGVHPFAGVATAIRNTIVAGCNIGIHSLENVAINLYRGLIWVIDEFVSGVKSFMAQAEHALQLLWDQSLPALFISKLRPLISDIVSNATSITTLTRTVGDKIGNLDARIDRTASATLETADRHAQSLINVAVNGINDDLRVIKSTTQQAVDHALALARAESQQGLASLREAEDNARSVIQRAENATEAELRDLIRELDPTTLLGIVATVPVLSSLVNTLARESGLDNAECRTKVKGICGTSSTDWSWLLGSIGALGLGFSLPMVIEAGQDVLRNLDEWANEVA